MLERAADDEMLAQMGRWKNSGRNKNATVYRAINPAFALTKDDVISMLTLREQALLPVRDAEETHGYCNFSRTIWTGAVN